MLFLTMLHLLVLSVLKLVAVHHFMKVVPVTGTSKQLEYPDGFTTSKPPHELMN